jgi:hypothetical protein
MVNADEDGQKRQVKAGAVMRDFERGKSTRAGHSGYNVAFSIRYLRQTGLFVLYFKQ